MNRHLPLSPSTLSLLAVMIFLLVPAIPGQNEETIINKVPNSLPIKVVVLYGKEARLLENAKIKVTNTGHRPIYYLDFILSTEEYSGLDKKYGVTWLTFGRTELRTFGSLSNKEDPSLQPGESLILGLNRSWVERFKLGIQANQQVIPDKYELVFQLLSFGDGTGFWTVEGVPFPSKIKTPSPNPVDHQSSFFSARI